MDVTSSVIKIVGVFLTKNASGQRAEVSQDGGDFAIGEMKVGHGGVGSHPARIGQPAVEGLIGFAAKDVIEVGGFERAAPADDVTTAAVEPLYQRRADLG